MYKLLITYCYFPNSRLQKSRLWALSTLNFLFTILPNFYAKHCRLHSSSAICLDLSFQLLRSPVLLSHESTTSRHSYLADILSPLLSSVSVCVFAGSRNVVSSHVGLRSDVRLFQEHRLLIAGLSVDSILLSGGSRLLRSSSRLLLIGQIPLFGKSQIANFFSLRFSRFISLDPPKFAGSILVRAGPFALSLNDLECSRSVLLMYFFSCIYVAVAVGVIFVHILIILMYCASCICRVFI